MRATHDEVELELVVADKRELAERVCALSLRRPDGAFLPSWTPGAHIDLELGPDLVRQYSLCGDPAELSSWEVAVLLEDESRGGSSYVHTELTTGKTVQVRGPRNLFPLETAPRYLFVAGGIGITPLIPMIADVASRGAEWQLVYGGRRRSSMAFVDELTERHGDRVRILPEDETGLLPLDELMRAVSADTAIYCCGPEGLIAAVEKLHGNTASGTLHVERFGPKELGEPVATGTFDVEAAKSGTVVTVDPDTTILDALRVAGVRVLSSCAEGICGTCEVFVLDGQPEHRDSILTQEEREANETMFVCVSRSLSERLVLDI